MSYERLHPKILSNTLPKVINYELFGETSFELEISFSTSQIVKMQVRVTPVIEFSLLPKMAIIYTFQTQSEFHMPPIHNEAELELRIYACLKNAIFDLNEFLYQSDIPNRYRVEAFFEYPRFMKVIEPIRAAIHESNI